MEDLTININIENDVLNVLSVGCWGVYCNQGEYLIFKDKEGEIKQEIVLRGQKIVAKSLELYTKNHPYIKDMFLAGDNIYQIGIEKKYENRFQDNRHLETFLFDNFELQIKDRNSVFNIQKQISEGFEKCFEKVNIKRYFVAVGNHDIETCEILNTELKNDSWIMPNTYYNVVYNTSNNVSVNCIVIDTNMFEEVPLKCDKSPYTQDEINEQINWIKSVSNIGSWKIVIGHIPYIANGHKKKKPQIFNNSLSQILDIVNPQVYLCADEHNQQFLYNQDRLLSLIVCGSGGTALDEQIFDSSLPENTETIYKNATFGFVHLSIDQEQLKIKYIDSTTQKNTFEVLINKNGNIIV